MEGRLEPSDASPFPPQWQELSHEGDLLLPNGALSTWGYRQGFHLRYNRKDLSLPSKKRLKEWEHFTILSHDVNVAISLADFGFAAFGLVEVADNKTGKLKTNIMVSLGKRGALEFPEDPYSSTHFRKGPNFVNFRYSQGQRLVEFNFAKTLFGPAISASLLIDQGRLQGISAVSPYRQKDLFFYEYKVPGMRTEGTVTVGHISYELKKDSAKAILDWGRGAWPKNSAWFWGHASGSFEGDDLSLNFGHGYEEHSAVSLNAIFFAGHLHKLGPIAWHPPSPSEGKNGAWRLKSLNSDGVRCDLMFTPHKVQKNTIELIFCRFKLFKMFGTFSGILVLEGGNSIQVNQLQGHLEKMNMRL